MTTRARGKGHTHKFTELFRVFDVFSLVVSVRLLLQFFSPSLSARHKQTTKKTAKTRAKKSTFSAREVKINQTKARQIWNCSFYWSAIFYLQRITKTKHMDKRLNYAVRCWMNSLSRFEAPCFSAVVRLATLHICPSNVLSEPPWAEIHVHMSIFTGCRKELQRAVYHISATHKKTRRKWVAPNSNTQTL